MVHFLTLRLYYLETVCPLNITNVQLPDNCTAKVDEVCDGFTCGYGYERNTDVVALNCTESGNWNYNTSALCEGKLYDTYISFNDLCKNMYNM